MIQDTEVAKVLHWATDKGLFEDPSAKFKQLAVLLGECKEYADEPDNPLEFGDVIVTMINTGMPAGANVFDVFNQERVGDTPIMGIRETLFNHVCLIGEGLFKGRNVQPELERMYRSLMVFNGIWLTDTPEKCLRMAYRKIASRNTKTIDGMAVKESDYDGGD